MINRIEMLSINEILKIIKTKPEQVTLEFKKDLNFGKTEDEKSNNIKDIVAIANSLTDSPGYIFYGVNNNSPEPLLNVKKYHDDGQFQQLVEGKVEPEIKFLFYPVEHKKGKIYVIHIEPSYNKPHVIIENYGKLRVGQIFIRKGSTNSGIRRQDLIDIFYDPRNPLFKERLNIVNSISKIIQSYPQLLEQLKADEDDIDKEVKRLLGLK